MMAMSSAKVARIRGKPETFDATETDAIRKAVRGYVKRNDLTSGELARKLTEEFATTTSQQTAAGYVNGKGGFSWPGARAIAWLLGYEGVDELLKEHGAFKSPTGAVSSRMPERTIAATHARAIGVSETAMARVNERIGNEHHIARWWVDKYLQEQYAVDAERASAAEDARASRDRKRKRGA